MLRARMFTVLSFLVSGAALFGSLLTSSVRFDLRENALDTLVGLAIIIVVLGWPWFGSFVAASKPEAAGPATGFAIVSALLSLAFAPFIARQPAEGVGWFVLICLLLIWAVYWASVRMRSSL